MKIYDKPTTVLCEGDIKKAETFVGQARSQMEILRHQMSLGGLSQGKRYIWLNTETFVTCQKCFNSQECIVWVKPHSQEKDKKREVFLYIKPTFNGYFSEDLGQQKIMYTYIVDEEEKCGWFLVYGRDYNSGPFVYGGCSHKFEFETTEERQAFIKTATFYVAWQEANSCHNPAGITFTHFKLLRNFGTNYDVNQEYIYHPDGVREFVIGYGDGTKSPHILNVELPLSVTYNGEVFIHPPNSILVHASNKIKIFTEDGNGNQLMVELDKNGFPLDYETCEAAHFNTITGKWDIRIKWKVPPCAGAPIFMRYYPRGYGDINHVVESRGGYALLREVDFIEADNKLSLSHLTYLPEAGFDVYQIDFTGLYVMQREPDPYMDNWTYTANDNRLGRDNEKDRRPIFAIEYEWYDWQPLFWQPYWCLSTSSSGWGYSLTREYKTLEPLPANCFLGIISNPDGSNPQRSAIAYAGEGYMTEDLEAWYMPGQPNVFNPDDSYYCLSSGHDVIEHGGTEGGDAEQWAQGNTCPCGTTGGSNCRWIFSMIKTPQEAFVQTSYYNIKGVS